MSGDDIAAVALLGVTFIAALVVLACWIATGRRTPRWMRW